MHSQADLQIQRKTQSGSCKALELGWVKKKKNLGVFRVVFFQLMCSTAFKGRHIKCGRNSSSACRNDPSALMKPRKTVHSVFSALCLSWQPVGLF